MSSLAFIRTDLERAEVKFTERGKVYNLLSCMPDPGVDVVWETGGHPENSKTLVGRTSGGFPIPSRVQNGIDAPVVSDRLNVQSVAEASMTVSDQSSTAWGARAHVDMNGANHSGVVGVAAAETATAVEHSDELSFVNAGAVSLDTNTAVFQV